MVLKVIALLIVSIYCCGECLTCSGQDPTLPDAVGRLGQGSAAEREQAITYLSSQGKEVVPLAAKLLDTGTVIQQIDAAKLLGRMRVTGTNAIPKLREIMIDEDRDWEVRLCAAKGVWSITQDVVSTISTIRAGLRDSEKQTRLAAIDIVTAMGRDAKMAIPDLITQIDAETAADTTDFSVLIPLQVAVNLMEEEAVPALREALTSENQKLVEYAAIQLGNLSIEASDAIDDLYDAYHRCKSHSAQINIANAIWKTANDHAFALEVLQDAIRADSTDKTGQLAAVIGLKDLGAAALPAQGRLLGILSSDNLQLAIVSALALHRQGVRDARMEQIVKRAFEAEDFFGYRTACELVREMEVDGEPFIPLMGEKLRSPTLHWTATQALVGLEKRAVPFLIQCLGDADPVMRLRAVDTLGKLGSVAIDALPQLNVLVTNKDEKLRTEALSAIVKVSGSGDGALSAQVAALGSSDGEVRLNAIKSISTETSLPVTLLPTLGNLLEDSQPQVRSFAALTIGTFEQKGRPLAEVLLKAFEDEEDGAAKGAMALALVQLDENDIRALSAYGLVMASEKSGRHRIRAVMAIKKFGSAALPFLTSVLSDQHPEVIAAAAWGLSTFGLRARESSSELMTLLDHADPSVRSAAVDALGNVSVENSHESVPRIIQFVRTEVDPDAKRSGIKALGGLSATPGSTVEFLLDVIGSSNESTQMRQAAASSLWRITGLVDIGEHSVRICNSLNAKDDSSVIQSLCNVLERLGANAITALPSLRQIAMDKSNEDGIRNVAIDVIRVLQKNASVAAGDLLSILRDAKQHPLHVSAALAIESIGTSATDIPELIKLLGTPEPKVCSTICRILGSHGADAESAKDALLSLFQNADTPQVRGSALQSLCMIAPNTPGLPKLVERALSDPNPDLQAVAAQSVMSLNTNAKSLLPALKVALKIKKVTVQIAVLEALSALGADAREVVPDLIEMLNSDVPREFGVGLSSNIANALGQIGAEATPAVPALMDALKPEKNFYERKAIVDALDQIGLNNDPKHTAKLASMLTASSDFPYFRVWAARTLSQLGPSDKSAIRPLIQSLEDNAVGVRYWSVVALGAFGSDARSAVDALRKRLKDTDDRVVAVAIRALGEIGKDAAVAVPDIGEFTLSSNEEIVTNACLALGRIGVFSDQIPLWLIPLLKTPSEPVASAAVDVLAGFGTDITNSLAPELRSKDDTNRRLRATRVLGLMGAKASDRINDLRPLLEDEVEDVRQSTAIALTKIVTSMRSRPEAKDLETIERVNESIQKASLKEDSPKKLIEELTHEYRGFVPDSIVKHIVSSAWFVGFLGIAITIAAVLGSWSIFLWKWPLGLLAVSDGLRKFELDIKLPRDLGTLKLPIRTVLLLKPFVYKNRVLDAWVKSKADYAKKQFESKHTVKRLELHVNSVLVRMDDSRSSSMEIMKKLAPLWSRPRLAILIHGEGGSGKTSLACALARYLMSPDRPAGHFVFPILIEEPFKETDIGQNGLRRTIYGKLQELIEDLTDDQEELVDELLRNRRILVIVDRLSEMSDHVQAAINPADMGWKINALLVTSRKQEPLGGVGVSALTPCRLDGSGLVTFVEDYLKQKKQPEVDGVWFSRFDENEILFACLKLSRAVTQKWPTLGNEKPTSAFVESVKSVNNVIEMAVDSPVSSKIQLNEISIPITPVEANSAISLESENLISGVIVPERPRACTAFLAERLANTMIELKLAGKGCDHLPDVILPLIYGYVDELNAKVPQERRLAIAVVHAAVARAAWKCIETHLRPGDVAVSQIVETIEGENGVAMLNYLIEDLVILKRVGLAQDHVQFELEPLAEYYACMFALNNFRVRGSSAKWNRVEKKVKQAQETQASAQAVLGFCDAMLDCVASTPDSRIPANLIEELYKVIDRAGLRTFMNPNVNVNLDVSAVQSRI